MWIASLGFAFVGTMTGTITAADAAVLKVPAGDWTD